MTPPDLTATSYAILGLLAQRPWTTYELTREMARTLGRFWPRARSKLYEEPRKLVAHGLAVASEGAVGRRPRTLYAITPAGRRALAAWLTKPGGPPTLEWEVLLKVFFAQHGTTRDLLANLAAARHWAQDQPERSTVSPLIAGFLAEFAEMVERWSVWAAEAVDGAPDEAPELVLSLDVAEDAFQG